MRPFTSKTMIIPAQGIQLHAEVSGPEDGPLVVLLHGFPECWYGWKNQIGPLAQSGFRVVAPDQRGYNLSDRPAGIDAYQISTLAKDILGIIDFFGREKATVIGHDWGAAVAWYLAIHYPERVDRLGILNVPHPAALARALTQPVWRQVLRSWYIYFFQIPRLPEFFLRLGHYAPMRRMLRASAKTNTFSKEDLRRYTEAWSRPQRGMVGTSALTGMLNWYRAAGRGLLKRNGANPLQDSSERVQVPTLILWGDQDVALIPELAQWSLELCDRGRLVRFPEATHWVQHDEAERITNRLLDFLEDSRSD